MDRVLYIEEREYCNQRYRVTVTEHSHIPPWGDEPCCFQTAKWEKLPPQQMTLFDE